MPNNFLNKGKAGVNLEQHFRKSRTDFNNKFPGLTDPYQNNNGNENTQGQLQTPLNPPAQQQPNNPLDNNQPASLQSPLQTPMQSEQQSKLGELQTKRDGLIQQRDELLKTFQNKSPQEIKDSLENSPDIQQRVQRAQLLSPGLNIAIDDSEARAVVEGETGADVNKAITDNTDNQQLKERIEYINGEKRRAELLFGDLDPALFGLGSIKENYINIQKSIGGLEELLSKGADGVKDLLVENQGGNFLSVDLLNKQALVIQNNLSSAIGSIVTDLDKSMRVFELAQQYKYGGGEINSIDQERDRVRLQIDQQRLELDQQRFEANKVENEEEEAQDFRNLHDITRPEWKRAFSDALRDPEKRERLKDLYKRLGFKGIFQSLGGGETDNAIDKILEFIAYDKSGQLKKSSNEAKVLAVFRSILGLVPEN